MATLNRFIGLQLQWQKTWQLKLQGVSDEPTLPDDLNQLIKAFMSDYAYCEAQVLSLSICNGSFLAEISNFLSGTVTPFIGDESFANSRRPSAPQSGQRTASSHSEQSASMPVPDFARRNSGSFVMTPLAEDVPRIHPPMDRDRANSAILSMTPSTQSSVPRAAPYFVSRPSASVFRGADPSPGILREHETPSVGTSANTPASTWHTSDSTHYSAANRTASESSSANGQSLHYNQSLLQHHPNIFSSAMPVSDSPPNELVNGAQASNDGPTPEPEVLFLAASLFDFSIDGTRAEAGFPYLAYMPGEVSRHPLPLAFRRHIKRNTNKLPLTDF